MDIKQALVKLGLIAEEDGETKQAEEAVMKALADSILERMGMDAFTKSVQAAIQTMDAFVKKQDERIEAIETVVKTMAASDVERVHQLVTSGDWTKNLFTASEAGEEADEAAAKAAKDATTVPLDQPSSGFEAYFGGGK